MTPQHQNSPTTRATKPKAILCGYYGMGNTGDEALLATLLQMLPPDLEPIVLSANPSQTYQQHPILRQNKNLVAQRFNMPEVLGAMRSAAVFIWGGGSLMQDVTSWRNPIYYGGLMGLAQGMGLKTVAWGQGIGPLTQPLSQWITRQSLQGCNGVTVRDRASSQLLEQWQIPHLVAPDPVFALESTTPPPLTELCDELRDGATPPEPYIGVVLRPSRHLTPERFAVLQAALIDLQAETQGTIFLVPFQPMQDLAIAEALHQGLDQGLDQTSNKGLSKGLNRSYILTTSDPRQMKGYLAWMDLTIAMRLHGVIMAVAEGTRCYALSYDPKVTYLMEQLHLPGCELTQLPNAQTLTTQWLDLLQLPATVSPQQRQDLKRHAQEHQQALEL
ncbi:MAG: polysaccharide pyruvyl transferase CsaB [Pseudanabaenaceae cyanobacterium]|jgi:polysaccharide pyruvyl transferase CsaB